MKLHPFQSEAVNKSLVSLRAGRAVLLVAPTGAGKTVMAGAIARRFNRILYVSHRQEHINQANSTMGENVQAMTIQAALSYGPRKTDLLIIDEAHRAAADTYRQLIERYPRAARLGLTATPKRTDGQGLCDAFDELIEAAKIKELVPEYLVPYRALEAPDDALRELDSLRKHCGDYKTKDLDRMINTPRLVGDVVREYLKHGAGRKAIVFAVSVDHSKNALTPAFLAAGVRAEHLDGYASSVKRAETLRRLADGDIDVLCNVNLFTEGWDCPVVSCVIMARPTASETLYLQSVGRGFRVFPGKEDLVILDHAGNIQRHGYPDEDRDLSLLSKKQEERRGAEVNELERMYRLGFASLEEYELAQRRILESTYSAAECAELLSVNRLKLCRFLSAFGLTKDWGRGCKDVRYPKSSIDAIIARRKQCYTLDECRRLLRCKDVSKFLHSTRTFNSGGTVGRRRFNPEFDREKGYYPKDDIDRIVKELEIKYTTEEAAEVLGKSGKGLSEFLKGMGIDADCQWPTFYLKSAIHNLASVCASTPSIDLENTLSTQQVQAIMSPWINPQKVWDGLSSRGIKPITGRNSSVRYSRAEVEALAKDLEGSYSSGECRDLFAKYYQGQISAFFERNGVGRISGWSGSIRYRKNEVDDLLGWFNDSYSAAECVVLLNGLCSRQNLARFLSQQGVQKGKGFRYPKERIERIVSGSGTVRSFEKVCV